MTTPHPLAVRGYQSEVARQRKRASRAVEAVVELASALRANLDRGSALSDVRQLATDVSDLNAALSALSALRDVDFLTESTET